MAINVITVTLNQDGIRQHHVVMELVDVLDIMCEVFMALLCCSQHANSRAEQ